MKNFRQDFPEAKLFLLHRGGDTTVEDGILCLPCEIFLRHLKPGMPLSHEAVRTAAAAELLAMRCQGV